MEETLASEFRHEGWLGIRHVAEQGTTVLSHALTGERCELSGAWQLGFSEGSGLLVDPQGQPSWVNQHLAYKVVATGAKLSVIQQGGVQRTPLLGFMASHAAVACAIQMVGSDGLVVDVSVFQRSCSGASVWWSLPSLHAGLGLKGAASAWYHRHWAAWEGFCGKLGMGVPHLRRAATTKQSNIKLQDGVDVEGAFRCLQVYTASTFAVVAIAVRLAAQLQAREVDQQRQACFRSFLSGLVSTFFLGTATWSIYMAASSCQPGLPLVGSDRVELQLQTGKLDLLQCLHSPSPLAVSLCMALHVRRGDTQRPLPDIMIQVYQLGARHRKIFMQLVWHMATAIELALCAQAGPGRQGEAEPAGGVRVLATQSRSMAAKLKRHLEEKHAATESARLLQYFFASRQHFHDKRCLSMCIDFARIGKKSIGLGAVGSPEGVAAIFPPQAISQ